MSTRRGLRCLAACLLPSALMIAYFVVATMGILTVASAVARAPRVLGDEPDARAVSPLRTTREMRRWVRSRIPCRPVVGSAGMGSVVLRPGAHRQEEARRLRQLWRALMAVDGLALRDDPSVTRTAAEMFREGRGDCVSFAHLFVALARQVEVGAFFVRVGGVEAEEHRGNLQVATRHLAAGWGDRRAPWIIDFAGIRRAEDFGERAHRVPDGTAEAIYWSNLGAQALLAGEPDRAVDLLEHAVTLAPELAEARGNLVVAQARTRD